MKLMRKMKVLHILLVLVILFTLLPANMTFAATISGAAITLDSSGYGSATYSSSISSGNVVTHVINTPIDANKIVVIYLTPRSGGSLPSSHTCTLTLANNAGGTNPTASNGGWYNPSKMTYYKTSDSSKKTYTISLNVNTTLSTGYIVNVQVVNAVSTPAFAKADTSGLTSSNRTYCISNSPEGLTTSISCRGENGYYLQRSRVQGNTNIVWEHSNLQAKNMVFGVLLWNKETSSSITVTLNRRGYRSRVTSTAEETMCGPWVDWLNGTKMSTSYTQDLETSVTIPANTAKWIHLNDVPYNSGASGDIASNIFDGVMDIRTTYTGTNLYCDTYLITPGTANIDFTLNNVSSAQRASAVAGKDDIRGSGAGAILATPIGNRISVSQAPAKFIFTGYDAPMLNSGEGITLTDYYNGTSSSETRPVYKTANYGVVYYCTFNFSSSISGTIKGKIKADPKVGPNLLKDQYAGIYAIAKKSGSSSVYKKLIFSGGELVFDTAVPKGTDVTYWFILGPMSSTPMEIEFTTN